MALTTSKSINLSGQSVINGVTVETYTASCSEANPKTMYIQQSTTNQEIRKENRTQCVKTVTSSRSLHMLCRTR